MNLATWLLIAAQLAAGGADAYQTNVRMHSPNAREYDPIARPFVHKPSTLAFYFGATTALHIAGPLVLFKRHKRLQRLAQIEGVVENGAGAAVCGTNAFPTDHGK